MYPWYDINIVLDLCGLYGLKTHNLGLIVGKISGKFQYTGILQNTWLVLLKTTKVEKQENKEVLNNYPSQEESKEIIQLNIVLWDRILEEKMTSDKNKEIQINYG